MAYYDPEQYQGRQLFHPCIECMRAFLQRVSISFPVPPSPFHGGDHVAESHLMIGRVHERERVVRPVHSSKLEGASHVSFFRSIVGTCMINVDAVARKT